MKIHTMFEGQEKANWHLKFLKTFGNTTFFC